MRLGIISLYVYCRVRAWVYYPGMDIHEWLDYGVEHGFCSDVVCFTHDGFPYTDEEEEEFDAGYDPCISAVRIWIQ